MQFHPLSIYPLVYSGKGGIFNDETNKNSKGSPLINLDLEICGFGKQSCKVEEEEEENILFTAAQFQQLYLQVVIFKYLSFGLPVPFHLLLPILKSFPSSLGCGLSPRELAHRSVMDTEPGRCRRTDGKKWRCRSNVVTDQKYCANHMNRGSERSRKRVEASKDIQKSNTKALDSSKTRSPNAITNGRISAPVSTSLDLTIPSPTVEVDVTSISCNGSNEGSNTRIVQADSGVATSSLLGAQVDTNNTRNKSNRTDSRGLGSNHFSTGKTYSCNQVNKNSGKPSIAAGFGASPPKSNHQGGIGTGSSSSSFDNKAGMWIDQRCRRTDGKRWRCARDVVPSKNYCENHLHRGAKRAAIESKSITGAPGDSSLQIPKSCGIHKKVKNSEILNTNLSISISSSDSTTVSI